MISSVVTSPGKAFFVSMLTRDIELTDAIMDLLDNSVDGSLRQQSSQADSEMGYSGYWAKMTTQPTRFEIQDNCGGIPRQIAIKNAFRFGWAETGRDNKIASVGMYGIGMKRALFKMGRRLKVISQHQGEAYFFEITPEWLDDDSNWELQLNDCESQWAYDGTKIIVTELHPQIAHQFDVERHNFLSHLRTRISTLFAQRIKKGFAVFLNGDEIQPTITQILAPHAFIAAPAIQPYAYQATIDDVQIELIVGFHRGLASEQEIEEELQFPHLRDNAGWTVICNDRVILDSDKSAQTGWGGMVGMPVPKYQSQFMPIAGVVRFSSSNSLKLPLNTSKRGLDTESYLYWHAYRYMTAGMIKFIAFTNQWKGQEEKTNRYFEDLQKKEALEVLKAIPEEAWKGVRDLQGESSQIKQERRFLPTLPKPEQRTSRISFLRPQVDIDYLREWFFDDMSATPSEVGQFSFDRMLRQALEAA